MNEIKCPKCGTVFQIDEQDYESIVKQVRDHTFEEELNERKAQFQRELESAVKLAKADTEKKLLEQVNQLKMANANLETRIQSSEEEKKQAVQSTKAAVEKEYTSKISELTLSKTKLENDLKLKDTENKLAVEQAISAKDKTIDSLSNELSLKEKEFQLKETSMKESYESKLKDKDEQIAYYKDFKARQSTKMIGESLEQHCSTEFNKLRSLFKNCYFEKDNDAKTGSKGDFIFRAYADDEHTSEIVSIMFEMKNEADQTATKHKNEDFFKELDKDRREKKCEYAVLVSLLELDNEYYNVGIVDVSYQYEKMYVIRPQFFIPLITLIKDLASKSLEYKNELELVRSQNIDITHFEQNINTFKDSFSRNYRLASERFAKAIEEIDKTIDHLQKTKEHLLKTEDNLRLANNKAQDLTIKKLTHKNPTMAKMFDDLKKNADDVSSEVEAESMDLEDAA
ncbi:pF09903 family protein [Bacillus sp. CAG:988]|nr:pF09903 family protein [Bacillus sp. CAG:988]